ncbi:MAG: hypothetical protein RL491_76, partial [Bacteroidota bacterium]
NTKAMLGFLQKGNKSEWERFVADLYPVKAVNIHEFNAIFAAFNGDFDFAVTQMSLAGELGKTKLLGDPFLGQIKDCHDCDHARTQSVKYTKLDMLKRMQVLSNNLKSGKSGYDSHLELAHAFYNLSYYGNARIFYENLITAGTSSYSEPVYPGTIESMKLARKHYESALKLAPNREAKAMCQYMLAKCERNDYYTSFNQGVAQYDENNDFIAFKEWDGFKRLKQDYQDTRFYNEVIRECGYFKTYMQNSR